MKKVVVVLIVVLMILAIAAPAMAHPPHKDGGFGNKANINAKDGLHVACGAVGEKPVASHVLLNWVGPGPHGPAE